MVPAAKWLGLNVILWGIATACGAAAHNYRTLLVSRIFLGIFEATIGPSHNGIPNLSKLLGSRSGTVASGSAKSLEARFPMAFNMLHLHLVFLDGALCSSS
jgi:hypothetical protein